MEPIVAFRNCVIVFIVNYWKMNGCISAYVEVVVNVDVLEAVVNDDVEVKVIFGDIEEEICHHQAIWVEVNGVVETF